MASLRDIRRNNLGLYPSTHADWRGRFYRRNYGGLTGVITVGVAISGYGNSIICLIVCAFLLARAFIKSGHGRRISFLIIKAIGK